MTTSARVLTVRFTEPDEYLAELERDVFAVERKIVRVSRLYRRASSGAYSVALVRAGAIVEGRPILFERLVGTLWGFGPGDDETQAKLDELVAELERGIDRLGLQARPGVLEVVGE